MGKKVLHLGCVGFVECSQKERIIRAKESLHYKLTKASDVVGVDYSKDIVNFFREKNIFSNVLCGDVEHLDRLGFRAGQFDFIVIGDIIEHLSNPGKMVGYLKKLGTPETIYIVTTPNATGLPNLLRYFFNKDYEGSDHVLSFSIFTLNNLFNRHGFVLYAFNTCYQTVAAKKNSVIFPLGRLVLNLFPKWGGTLLCQFKLKNEKNG